MAKKKPTTSTAGTLSPPKHIFTHWLTRDTHPETGALSENVRVWLAPPSRLNVGIGAVWMAPGADDLYGEWSAMLWHTRPDDDRQCIRIEGSSVRAPGDAVEPIPS